MAERQLKDLSPGEQGKVVRVDAEGALKRRLMDMGLTRGTMVTFRKVAPFVVMNYLSAKTKQLISG